MRTTTTLTVFGRLTAFLALSLVGSATLAVSCTSERDDNTSSSDITGADLPGLTAVQVFKGVKTVQPTALLQAPGDNKRFFVLEKTGRVLAFDNDDKAQGSKVFLDLKAPSGAIAKTPPSVTDPVVTYEEGLLNMVFHPKWQSGKRQAFVYYNRGTAENNLFVRLSRFTFDEAGEKVISEEMLLEVKKDRGNHNGGGMVFGKDGFLYLGIGDGGKPDDELRRAQNKNHLLGKVIRLDIDQKEKGLPYAIPKDNPFATSGQPCQTAAVANQLPAKAACAEIFSFGHRNPWRIAVDNTDGTLYEAEVGQEFIEEVNILKLGKNYGWNAKEGSRVLHPEVLSTIQGPLEEPVSDYGHGEGQSITGGLVYRGKNPALKKLVGRYVFGDFASGDIWAIVPDATQKTGFVRVIIGQTGRKISSFGEDAEGNLFVVDHNTGGIYRLDSGPPIPPRDPNQPVHLFLSRDGAGTPETAFKYYESIGAPKNLTLDTWLADHVGTDPSQFITAFYQNIGDLGFWRDMRCSKTISPGKGGCAVTNYLSPQDREKKINNQGTVCMDVSPLEDDGKSGAYTRFYVFGGDGKLSPVAKLDYEGPKAAPQLCTPCHSGKYSGQPNMGALFREFEPAILGRAPGKGEAEAEREFFKMNEVIKTANNALLKPTDLSPDDKAAITKQLTYIDEMYAGQNPESPKAAAIGGPAHLPESWKKPEGNRLLTQAKVELWGTTVGAYCMQCHRFNSEDFASYQTFTKLASVSDGVSDLQRYIGFKGEELEFTQEERNISNVNDRNFAKLFRRKKQYMPNAFETRRILLEDKPALTAIDQWLAQAQDENRPQVKVTFEVTTPTNLTVVGQNVYVIGSLRQIGFVGAEDKNGRDREVGETWSVTSALRLNAASFVDGFTGETKLRWSGSAVLPFGAQYRWKSFVMSEKGELVRWQCLPLLNIDGVPFKGKDGQGARDMFDIVTPVATEAQLTLSNAVKTNTFFDAKYENTFHAVSDTKFGANGCPE